MKITKDGFKSFEWDSSVRDYAETEFRPLRALRDGVEIEDGVTLADIIRFTARDEFLNAFISEYCTCSVSAFAQEIARTALIPISPDRDVQYAVVSAHIDISEAFRSLPNRIQISTDFHGRGNDEKTWSLDLSPIEDIALLPVRLDKKAIISKFENGNFERDETRHYTLSLLDVLDAIFYDISFHGSPGEDRKKEIMDNLKQAMEEIENGTATLVPFPFDESETSN